MSVLKAFFIAFSIYSKIPVPQFEWREEDMKYMLCFFPWVGIVTGILVYGWGMLCKAYQTGELCYILVGAAIPLLVTGGFHMDGFMDTMDAFHSYQPRERKLEILKDSHIGAFSVIMLVSYGLLYLASFSQISDERLLRIAAAGFFLSRVLGGISLVLFPKAKKDGLAYLFAGSAQKKIVTGTLALQGMVCIFFVLWTDLFAGIVILLAAMLVFGYYYWKSKKELGGITGDTTGYFIVICEGAVMIASAIINTLWIQG